MVSWESSETLLRLDRRPAYELLLCSSQLLGRPAASTLVIDFSSATELNVGMPLPRWTTKLSSLPARLQNDYKSEIVEYFNNVQHFDQCWLFSDFVSNADTG